jgi:hypothetical protein
VQQWGEVEFEVFSKRSPNKKYYVPIPDSIRMYFLREYIKGRFRKYFYDRQKALESMEEHSRHYYEFSSTRVRSGLPEALQKSLAAMNPGVDMKISKETYVKFIRSAETNRLNWSKLVSKKNAVFPEITVLKEEYALPSKEVVKVRERRQAIIPLSY